MPCIDNPVSESNTITDSPLEVSPNRTTNQNLGSPIIGNPSVPLKSQLNRAFLRSKYGMRLDEYLHDIMSKYVPSFVGIFFNKHSNNSWLFESFLCTSKKMC